MKSQILLAALVVAATSSCAKTKPSTAPTPVPAKDSASSTGPGGVSVPLADPFPSTYQRLPSGPLFIRNVTLMTAAGPTIRNGSIAIVDGKIVGLGANVTPPAGAT